MSSSNTEPNASCCSPLLHLIHNAFSIPNRNPWVANFLFNPDTIPSHDVVSGIEKASAPLVDCYLPGETSMSQNFALLPLFSKSTLTLGFRLQSSLSTARHPPTKCSKFVFDNFDTTLLSVALYASSESAFVTFMSNSLVSGRTLAYFQFDAPAFRNLTLAPNIPAAFLINALISCTVYWETGTKCAACAASWAENCACTHPTKMPTHPMHFEMLARNFVLYAGHFLAKKVTWKRCRKGTLTQRASVPAMCRLDVSVNQTRVSELCNLERSGGEGSKKPAL